MACPLFSSMQFAHRLYTSWQSPRFRPSFPAAVAADLASASDLALSQSTQTSGIAARTPRRERRDENADLCLRTLLHPRTGARGVTCEFCLNCERQIKEPPRHHHHPTPRRPQRIHRLEQKTKITPFHSRIWWTEPRGRRRQPAASPSQAPRRLGPRRLLRLPWCAKARALARADAARLDPGGRRSVAPAR